YYLSIGYSTDDMGKLMGAVFCGAVLAQGPAGWLSDRFDRAKLLITMMTVSLLISLCSLLFSPMLPFFYVGIGAFIFGAAIFSIYPLGISHSCDELYNKDLIGTLSVLLSVNSFGCLVSASFSGFFMTYFPVHGFYLYSTSLLAFLLVYLSYKLQKPLAQPA
ncbi:MAG: MFS family permease, partial [Chlamydiales bacterium]